MVTDTAAMLEASLDRIADETATTAAVAPTEPVGATEEPEPTPGQGDEPEAAAEPVEGEEPEGEETEDAEPEEDLDPLKAALAKHKAPRLEDLPEEARPLVEKRLKEMNAAFTRAQQEATTFRQEKAAYEAEKAYRQSNPVDAIVADLLASPRLLEQVNEELTKLTEPVYAEAKTKERETNQKIARLEAEDRRRQAEFYETRAGHVEDYTESLAASEGVPFALVEPLVAAAIEKNRNITDEQVAAIVKQYAPIYRRSVGAHKREAKKDLAKQKVADRKTAGLTVKPGASSAKAPAPPPAKTPKAGSFEDRTNSVLDSLGVPA
jgi:hypothetical protein